MNEINKIKEMNMAQPNIDPETGEERDTDEFTTSRIYNLQTMPTK